MNNQIYDPITLEIIQNALQSVSDEMFAALRNTAMSAIIYEVLDAGTGVTDADGELASSGAGIPSFIGVIDKTVKAILREHPRDTIRPGDIYATNDPWHGGVTHLNDMVIAMPIFAGGELIAWTANIAHWTDVGGMSPGSISLDAKEIWQEGLRVPAIKLFENGEPIAPVLAILKANSRMADYLEGDLWAAIAAVRVGEKRLQELATKYGHDTVLEAIRQYLDYGEMVTLQGLAGLPHGHWEIAEEQDDGRIFKASVDISDTELIIDLSDNPDQDSGPNNCSYDGAQIVGQMVLKNITDPQSVCNGGSFRPLQVLTREGSVFHATEGAAMGVYYEQEIRIYDAIMRCLAEKMPERLPGGHFASICGTYIGGRHPDTGREVLIVEPELGGWGANADGDGINALYSAFHGETFNCPAEICEARHGLQVDAIRLNDAGGGYGAWRGGRGIQIDYRIRYTQGSVTCGYTRSKFPPWGLAGGGEGTPNYLEVRHCDGSSERYAYANAIPLHAGDVVRVVTGNGGGYGDPLQRPRDRVLEDLRDGYISEHEARHVYGLN